MITSYPLLREMKELKLSNLLKLDVVPGKNADSSTLAGTPVNGIDGVIGMVGLDTSGNGIRSFTKTTHYTVSSNSVTFVGDQSAYEAAISIYQISLAASARNYPLSREIEDLQLSQLIGLEVIQGHSAGNTRTLTGTPRNGTNGVIDVIGIELSTDYTVKNCVRTTDYTVSGKTFTCVTDLSSFEALIVLYEKDISSTVVNYPLARELQELELRNFLRMEVFAGSDGGDVTLGNAPRHGTTGVIGVIAVECSDDYSIKVSSGHTVSGTTLTYGEDLSTFEACIVLYQY